MPDAASIHARVQALDLGLPARVAPFAKRALGLTRLAEAHTRALRTLAPGASALDFCAAALRELNVRWHLPERQRARINAISGPVLFASNHPLGGVDALVLLCAMGQRSTAPKLLANALVGQVPELVPALLPLHIMGPATGQRMGHNAATFKDALAQLRAGGDVGLFPAGEVAELRSLFRRQPSERPWSSHLGRLAKRARATVVPVHLAARPSALFLYAGLLAPPLRLALLAREILHPPSLIEVRYGRPIAWNEPGLDQAEALTERARTHCTEAGAA